MALSDGKRENFRHVVGMHLLDDAPDGGKPRGKRLDDEKSFGGVVHAALPAEDGLDRGNKVDARGRALGHQRLRHAPGLALGCAGHQHDDDTGRTDAAIHVLIINIHCALSSCSSFNRSCASFASGIGSFTSRS